MIPIETTCLVLEAPRGAKACAPSVRREIRVMPVGRVDRPGLFTRDFSTIPPRPASAPSANAGHFYPPRIVFDRWVIHKRRTGGGRSDARTLLPRGMQND